MPEAHEQPFPLYRLNTLAALVVIAAILISSVFARPRARYSRRAGDFCIMTVTFVLARNSKLRPSAATVAAAAARTEFYRPAKSR
jgi:hypothetical protein